MNHKEDKKHAAVCGLYCEACSIYIATQEDPERLAKIAADFKTAPEETKCHGCRSDKRLSYCAECRMFECAAQKGIDFCSLCDDYPCAELKRFQAERPHRIELWENLDRIRSAGYQQWLKEMRQHYACPSCEILNSAYDANCRKCGNDPSCEYVARYREKIRSWGQAKR